MIHNRSDNNIEKENKTSMGRRLRVTSASYHPGENAVLRSVDIIDNLLSFATGFRRAFNLIKAIDEGGDVPSGRE